MAWRLRPGRNRQLSPAKFEGSPRSCRQAPRPVANPDTLAGRKNSGGQPRPSRAGLALPLLLAAERAGGGAPPRAALSRPGRKKNAGHPYGEAARDPKEIFCPTGPLLPGGFLL